MGYSIRQWCIVWLVFVILLINYILAVDTSNDDAMVKLLAPSINLLSLIVGLGLALRPLGHVANAVEEDIVRDLNDSITLAQSRSLIGDLFLGHLSSLGWGFRYGGFLIDSKKVTNTIAGVTITVMSAIGQQVGKLAS